MTTERMRLLDSIGFRWPEPRGQALWDRRFNELVEYKNEVWIQQHQQLPYSPIYSKYFFIHFAFRQNLMRSTVCLCFCTFTRLDTVISRQSRERKRILVRSSIYYFGAFVYLSWCKDADTHAFDIIIIYSSHTHTHTVSLALAW